MLARQVESDRAAHAVADDDGPLEAGLADEPRQVWTKPSIR